MANIYKAYKLIRADRAALYVLPICSRLTIFAFFNYRHAIFLCTNKLIFQVFFFLFSFFFFVFCLYLFTFSLKAQPAIIFFTIKISHHFFPIINKNCQSFFFFFLNLFPQQYFSPFHKPFFNIWHVNKVG